MVRVALGCVSAGSLLASLLACLPRREHNETWRMPVKLVSPACLKEYYNFPSLSFPFLSASLGHPY